MARVFSGNLNVLLARCIAEQVLCLDRACSGNDIRSLGSSFMGAHSQFAPGVGRNLRLSAHACLFTAAIWRIRRPPRPGRSDRNIPDLLQRDFSTTEPNQVWVADITELATGEGKLYLCVIKDLYDDALAA